MTIKNLSDRKCLITGAASGIGRATAIAAATEGAELYLTDIQSEALEGTVAEIIASGGKVAYSKVADISDHDAVVAMASEIHPEHGSMDVIMNIAGISTWGTVDRLEHEHWRRLIEINLMGPIHVIECFIPPMIEARRGGHLVNVSSAAGLFGLPWHAAYSATKFGIRGVSEVLRYDLRRHRIGVSLVCPGGVATPLVGTVEIVGVDREHPRMKRLIEIFEKRAKSPEHCAEKILDGIKKDRYWVYTSNDIRFGHFWQRKFEYPYTKVMQLMNDRLWAASKPARLPRS